MAAEPSACTFLCPLPTAFSSIIPGTRGHQRTPVVRARRQDKQTRYCNHFTPDMWKPTYNKPREMQITTRGQGEKNLAEKVSKLRDGNFILDGG